MSRPPRQPRRELRRAILDAAREILAQDGAPGLTARAIARQVGYTAASIYTVFASMSDIIMEVNRDTFTELQGMLHASLVPEAGGSDGLAPREQLTRMLAAYISFMKQNPALWQALFGGMRQRESFPDWYVEAIRGLLQQIAQVVQAHAPHLSPEQALGQTEQLYVAIHGAVALHLDRRLELVSDQTVDQIASAALEAMLLRIDLWGARAATMR